MKNSRRRSREFALQGLYQWQLSQTDPGTIAKQLAESSGFDKMDGAYFMLLLNGVVGEAEALGKAIEPFLDRKVAELSPIERVILMMGAFELTNCPEVPYRVVINEAVDLAKSYGGTDGHKYVNGVLDKLAGRLRAAEARN
jgi:transcription antitermination protein NusB